MKKRVLSMLLVCSMILSLFPALNVTAFAASPESDFTVNDAGVITDYTGDGGVVDIPDTVGGVAVTGIDAYAFSFGYCNAEITEVTIPAGVDSIGAYAFLGQELTKVTFMGRCSDINFDAFDSMDGFTVHCRPADSDYYEYDVGFDTVVADVADAHTHEWSDGTVTTAPTCTEPGVKTFTCSGCDETKTEAVPAAGHSYENGVCTACGAKEPCAEHSWDNGTVTTAASCIAPGVKTFTCTVCGAEETEELPTVDHTYENGVCTVCSAKQFLLGGGTESNPYLISTADDLAALSAAVKDDGETFEGQYFALTDDITVTGKWTAIGYSSSKPFCGSFDGRSHSVTVVSGSGYSNYGLFGYVKNATIENLIVKGSFSGSNYVGGVVGQAVHTTLRNLGNEASVTGSTEYVGGVVGYMTYDTSKGSDPCTIEYCYNRGNVTCTGSSKKTVGGVAGGCNSMSSGTTAFVGCYNTGSVTSSGYAGGILGSNESGKKISFTDCYDAGPLTVAGKSYLGSMVGFCNNLGSDPKVTNCYYVTGKNSYVYSGKEAAASDRALGNGGSAGNAVDADTMKSADTLSSLGSSYKADSGINLGYPVLFWEKTCEHPVESIVSAAEVPATCTEKGYTAGTQCTLCGVYVSGHVEIAPLGHTHDAAGTVTAPTCTEQGYTTYICTRCTNSYNDDFVDATGHEFDDEGKCIHEGCTVTDSFYTFFSGVKQYLKAKNDDTGVWVYDGAKAQLKASGSKTGTFTLTAKKGGELTITAKPVSSTLTVKKGDAELKKISGNYSTTASSFTLRVESGDVLTVQYSSYSSNYYCELTNISYKADCDHLNREQNKSKAATCTEYGYESGDYCLDCGKYLGTPIAPTGHSVDETGLCSVCGQTDTFSLFFRALSDNLTAVNDASDGWTYTASSSSSYIRSKSSAKSGGFTLYIKEAGELKLSGKTNYYGFVNVSINGGAATQYPSYASYSGSVSYTEKLNAGDVVRLDYSLNYPDYYASDAYVRFESVSFTPDEIPVVKHTITATAGSNGSITPDGEVKVEDGKSQSFVIAADDGYTLDTLTVDGEQTSLTGTNSYVFTNVTTDHTINVTFKEAQTVDLFQQFFTNKTDTTAMSAQNSMDKPWSATPMGTALKASGYGEAVFTLTAQKDGYLTVVGEIGAPRVSVTIKNGDITRILSTTNSVATMTATDLPVKANDTITVTYFCDYPYANADYYAKLTAITIAENCPHTVLPYTEATAATCEADGCIAYYECLTCGKYFEDVACTKELTSGEVVIPAAHTYGEPMFTSGEARVVTCSVCHKTSVISGSGEGETTHTVSIAGANASWTAEGRTSASYSVGDGKDFYFIVSANSGYLLQSVSGAETVAGYEHLYKVANVTADASVTVNTTEKPETEYNFELRDSESGKVAYILGYNGEGGDITLPTSAVINGQTYSVVGVAEGAFCGNGNYYDVDGHTPMEVVETITSITVPVGVKYIEALAFNYVGRYHTKTWKLTSVTFEDPDTVFVPYILNDGTERNVQLGGNPNLTTVALPANLAKIPSSLFYEDTSLNDLVIPQGVASIGARAFEGCEGLKNLTMQSAVPPAVEMLSKTYPFKGCDVTITVPKGSLTAYEAAWDEMLNADPELAGSITLREQDGDVAFTQFTADNIEYRVVSREDMTVEVKYVGKNSNGKLIIPEKVATTKSIGGEDVSYTFTVVGIGEKAMDSNGYKYEPENPASSSSNYWFTEVEFPSTLQYIEKWGCAGLASVKTLDLSNTVLTRIGSFAFNNCLSVETISLPDTLTDLGVVAEIERTDDEMDGGEIDLPDGIAGGDGTNVDAGENAPEKAPAQGTENVFRGCQNLKQFVVSEKNPYFSVQDGVLFNKDGSKLIRYPVGKADTSYAIPEGTKIIVEAAFMQVAGNQANGALKTVTFPRSLRKIEDGAFRQSSLTSVELPANVTFGSYIFDCSKHLATVTVEDGVTMIPEKGFWGCEGLTNVTLADSVKSIGTSAFERAGFTSFDLKNVEKIGDYAFYGAKLESITVPEKVTTGTGAFMNCGALKTATVNGKKLDRYMFWYCTELETLTAPNVEQINEYALGYCVKLAALPLASVKSIGTGAFRNCHGLVSVTLPASLQSLGKYVFADCGKLTVVTFADGMGVVSLPEGTFYECVNLEEVHLGDSISQTEGMSLYMAGWYNGMSVEVYCNQPEDFFFRNEFDACFIDLGNQQFDNENADEVSYVWTKTTLNSEGEKVYHFKAKGGGGCGGGCGGGGGSEDELVEYTMTASVKANFHFAVKDSGRTSAQIAAVNAPRFAALQRALPTVLTVYTQDIKTGEKTEAASYTLPELESMADRTTAGYQYVGMKGWAVMAATEYVTIDDLLGGETFESGDSLIVSASDASYTVTWDDLQANAYFFPNSKSYSNVKVESGSRWVPAMIALTWNTGKIETEYDSDALAQVAATAYKSTNLRFAHGLSWESYESLDDCDSMATGDVCSAMRMLQRVESITLVKDTKKTENVVTVKAAVIGGIATVAAEDMHSVLDTLAEGGLLIIDAASSFTDSLSLTLSSEDTAALADKNAQLQLNTSIGSLTLDSASLAGLSRTANGGTVVLSIQKLLRSSLNNALQAELDEHAAVYSVTAVGGGKTVTNLNGLAQLKLPYTLQRDERADYIRTSMLGSDTLTRLAASYADGFVTFATSTLARFAVDVPDKLYSVTIVLAPVVRNGTASASVGVDEATKALEKLCEGGELILDARTLQAVTASEVSVPRTIVQRLIAKNQSLRVCANGSEIALDSTALRSAAASLTGANLRICTAQLANADLPIAARSIFETADLWRVWLSDGTRELTALANGSVSVTLSYTLARNQNASNIALYAVEANGGYTWLRAVNDKTAHTLTCTGYSLGTFVLTDRLDGVLPFTDVAPSDWYYDDVRYVYQNGLMNGVAPTLFAPQTNVTRGMLVTIFWREENEPSARTATFTDVARGSYYEKAIAWAESNGIVTGFGNGLFKPDDPITREQFVTILYRYASYKGLRTTASASLTSFSDASGISAYALDAVRWAVGAGLMNGRNGCIDPAGFTTRAESAALLHRYLA